MDHPICATCGTQFAATEPPPDRCPICSDERQYLGWQGQRWTTALRLAAEHGLRIGEDDGLPAFEMRGGFGIPQRALLLRTAAGNILWECLSLVTDEAVARLHALGGVDRIVISHPHFYAAMVDWSDALGGAPILLHAADRGWVPRPSRRIDHWHGDRLALGPGVTLVRSGGHFAGSTVLHWADGPRGGGALFVGDSPQVAANRRSVSFLYSYPNLLPLPAAEVQAMRQRLAGLDYDDAYGYSWGRNILGDARTAVDASFERYLGIVGQPAGVPTPTHLN